MNQNSKIDNLTDWASYKIKNLIATGLSADIYLGTGPNQEPVAIKIFLRRCETFFENELDVLIAMKEHADQNIIKMLGYGKVNSSQDMFWERYYIVFEYAPHGDLLSLIENEGGLGEDNSKGIFISILKGVESIHNSGFIHRDIKLENVLLSGNYNMLITDFGFCEKVGKISSKKKGTPGYIPPEAYNSEEIVYPEALDIFSLGVVLFLLVSGDFPFDQPCKDDPLYKYIVQDKWKEYWSEVGCGRASSSLSEEFKELFQGMVCYLPEMRLTIDDIKNHMWTISSVGQGLTSQLLRKRCQ